MWNRSKVSSGQRRKEQQFALTVCSQWCCLDIAVANHLWIRRERKTNHSTLKHHHVFNVGFVQCFFMGIGFLTPVLCVSFSSWSSALTHWCKVLLMLEKERWDVSCTLRNPQEPNSIAPSKQLLCSQVLILQDCILQNCQTMKFAKHELLQVCKITGKIKLAELTNEPASPLLLSRNSTKHH